MRRTEFLPLFFIAVIAIGITVASRQSFSTRQDTQEACAESCKSEKTKKSEKIFKKSRKNTKESFCSEKTVKSAGTFLSDTGVTCQVCELFAPRDDLKSVLIGLINAEKLALQMATFKFTDTDIGNALIEAHKRGVEVEVVADSSGLDTRQNQILRLHSVGVPVYVYPDPDFQVTSRFSIMHNKFLICHQSEFTGGMIVWTGSFNFTPTASHHNRENVVVVMSDAVATRYSQEFEILKKESQCLSKHLQKIKKEETVQSQRQEKIG